MPRSVLASFPRRLGAAMVALALTGAPALVARPEPSEHRCQCRHARDHECECARCHEATSKRAVADAQVPPCHRKAAEDGEHAPAGRLAGGPCMAGDCGSPVDQRPPITPLDAFTLPLPLAPGGALAAAGTPERPSGSRRDAPSVPETPPPRAGRAPAARA